MKFWIFFLAAFFVLAFPNIAFAQEGGETLLGLEIAKLALYLGIALGVVEVAKRVAALIPGKRDDEIVGVIDGLLRKLVDFVAGKTGRASDPSLVKRE